jgi:predicted phosphate transport protein (TIGR00153 family)
MSVIENLFTKSPFTPLQAHMEKVAECVEKLDDLYDAFSENDPESIERVANEISELEHSADLTKNEIRNNLPRGLFLAINRAEILAILSLQDSIADKTEDIGVLMTIKKLDSIPTLMEDFKQFLDKNVDAVRSVHNIIRELEKLLRSTFGGKEAVTVKQMVHDVSLLEHEADVLQHGILKVLYNMEDELSYASFSLWMNIVQATAGLGNLSEKLAYKILMLLETN